MNVKLVLMALASLAALAPALAAAELPSAEELLSRSIAYHDPQGAWPSFDHTLIFRESRPDGSVRSSRVTLDLPGELFVHEAKTAEVETLRRIEKGECSALLNGSASFSDEEATQNRLTCERIRFYRDYYTFLWGLPMKLRDPGTHIADEVSKTSFLGRDVLSLKVTYEPGVGGDTWYFYFDPVTYALAGYRFYHDEAKNDGEYIALAGEYQLGALKLPKARTWYVNADGKLLGTDELVGHE